MDNLNVAVWLYSTFFSIILERRNEQKESI